MKLKEIKPGMVIHCKTEDEAKELFKHLDSLGYKWNCTRCDNSLNEKSTLFETCGDKMCYEIKTNNTILYSDYDFYEEEGYTITEFSDLIIPEMSAEEVLQICSEICRSGSCDICPMGEEYCFSETESDKKKIIEICQQWKSDHEKKEPEIEWVYRVFGAESNGEKFFQTEEEAIKRCEELAKSQKSKQYARYERVCRVKAVE